MRILLSIIKWLAAFLVLAVVAAGVWLYVSPPALIRVGAGYSAKIVCSNVFVAGRDSDEVLALDVQAPGHWLLGLMSVDVDEDARTVSAGLFGIFGKGLAVHRQGTGCATVPDGNVEAVRAFTAPPPAAPAGDDALWPEGGRVEPSQNPAIAAILDDPGITGPSMRAVVVVRDGRIIGERYGEGFSGDTPLLGWSMTKTVTAAIIGTLVQAECLTVKQQNLLPRWDDERGDIRIADMLAMASGLEFNEDYGDVTDVTRMLYLEPDMAGFAAAKSLTGETGETFSYSSGTSVMLARIWQNTAGSNAAALAWPREALFAPLGMTSAVMEADARGTFVGSSYVYATARDWARFGQFLLQEGTWNGDALLPPSYVDWMVEPTDVSGGEYGRHVWLHGPTAGTPEGEDPDAGFDLPDDAYWLLGHDGQTMTVVPSEDLVVVRLGLTPSRIGYKPQRLVEALSQLEE